MSSGYDHNNIFAKILRREVPCKKIYENEYSLCFPDINPKAQTHLLLIPKGPFVDLDTFALRATAEEKSGFLQAISCISAEHGQLCIKINTLKGPLEHQEVFHFHAHIMSIDHEVEDKELGAELVEESDRFLVTRERNAQRAWIYCKGCQRFSELKNDADIFSAIPKVARKFEAMRGFNLHLFQASEDSESMRWRLDW